MLLRTVLLRSPCDSTVALKPRQHVYQLERPVLQLHEVELQERGGAEGLGDFSAAAARSRQESARMSARILSEPCCGYSSLEY